MTFTRNDCSTHLLTHTGHARTHTHTHTERVGLKRSAVLFSMECVSWLRNSGISLILGNPKSSKTDS